MNSSGPPRRVKRWSIRGFVRNNSDELQGWNSLFGIPVAVVAILLGILAAVGFLASAVEANRNEYGGDQGMEKPGVTPPDLDDRSRLDEATPYRMGICLTKDSRAAAGCDSAHTFEIYGSDECGMEKAVLYMGGTVGVDITTVELSELTIDQVKVCLLSVPDKDLNFSVRDALLQPSGDQLRACSDFVSFDVSLPCSESHTVEWVTQTPLPSQSRDCSEIAEVYLGAPTRNFYGELQVRSVEMEEGSRCAVVVLGNNTLTKSLRNIRTGSVPYG